MAMNMNEKRMVTKDTFAAEFIKQFPTARAVIGKDYTWLIPIRMDDGTLEYAQVGCTYKSLNATKVRDAFDPETQTAPAQAAFDAMLKERAEIEAEKAREKAAK